MNSEIIIKDMECFGFHGVLEEEKKLGQKFIVSAKLQVDFSTAIKSDECSDTVNYSEVCHFIVNEVKSTRFNLIESLANHLANEILLKFYLVENVIISVKKPWAPIGLNLDTVVVQVKQKWHSVYVGVGSNMGESETTIKNAVSCIENSKYNKHIYLTDLIKTKPYGYKEQGDFINGVISLKTILNPKEFLHFLQEIEFEMKRQRDIHWGPRTIDLDILLFDDLVTQDQEIIIPHPEMCKRDFVLKPLCEINPYLVHPLYHRRIIDIYKDLEQSISYERTIY